MTDRKEDSPSASKKELIDHDGSRLANAAKHLNAIADELETWFRDVKEDSSVSPATVAYALFQIKTVHADLDAAVKRVYHFHDGINKHLLPERLRAFDMDGIRVPEVARSFGIVGKMSASFVDKDKGFAWLRSIGQEDMIQETVNAGTLAAFCRNLILEEGVDPPEDIVKVSTYDTTSMTKYNPKGR